MRKIITLILGLLLITSTSYAQPKKDVVVYDNYFTNERLRIDLIFAGNKESQKVFLKELHKEFEWSGSKKNLLDYFHYGEYYYEVYSGEKLIFSKGFNSLFQEWRTTAEAKKMEKAFSSSIWMPYPKDTVELKIYERLKSTGKFEVLSTMIIDPSNKLISKDKKNNFKVVSILNSGDSEKKVDLLFVAEGYTEDEMGKFRKDSEKFSKYLFEMEPYKSRQSDFNIWAVESISEDTGTDIPQDNVWKNTVACSNFYTFEIDRYLTAPNHTTIASIISNSPFDAVYVIVNTAKYGGGGIYNFYGLSMSDHETEAEVFVHEFGHSFAGLADEYYSSDVAYEDFYNTKLEPWEPNITTLIDFDSKWKSMILEDTPIPTPNEENYLDILGLFEGGGYMSKGIYRPYFDCRMKTNSAKGFCPACQKGIDAMIDFYL